MNRATSAVGRADERGVSTVQVVLVMPLLMLLIGLSVQLAVWYTAIDTAKAAAAEGAQAAAYQGATTADGQARATAFLEQNSPRILSGRTVQASKVTVNGVDGIRVEVRAKATGLLGIAMPIRAVAFNTKERFRTRSGR